MNPPLTIDHVNRLDYAALERMRDLAQKVTCPTCGGPPGRGCAFLPGTAYVMRAYHFSRFKAAEEAGLI